MRDWDDYLTSSRYDWKDMFIFLIDGGNMHNLAKDMMDDGLLDELNRNELDEFVDHLDNSIRQI